MWIVEAPRAAIKMHDFQQTTPKKRWSRSQPRESEPNVCLHSRTVYRAAAAARTRNQNKTGEGRRNMQNWMTRIGIWFACLLACLAYSVLNGEWLAFVWIRIAPSQSISVLISDTVLAVTTSNARIHIQISECDNWLMGAHHWLLCSSGIQGQLFTNNRQASLTSGSGRPEEMN